jgi:hypothetical protein
MSKSKKLILVLAMACSALMVFNLNGVIADDDIEMQILRKVKQIKRILINEVIPRLDPEPGIPQGVPRTGQTECYDDAGNVIDCEGTGQDGELQKGFLSPEPRFTDNGDGTVTDNQTELVWLKNANCFGTRTWSQALSDCNNLADGDCGLTDGSSPGDWWLPNINQLKSLTDYGNIPVFPSDHPFINLRLWHYWSSTTWTHHPERAVYLHMNEGGIDFEYKTRSDGPAVWPVRDAY